MFSVLFLVMLFSLLRMNFIILVFGVVGSLVFFKEGIIFVIKGMLLYVVIIM